MPAFEARGVTRIFGIPGGGSSLDLIDAAGRRDIDFVLTRGETAAAIMAAVEPLPLVPLFLASDANHCSRRANRSSDTPV